MVKVKGSWRGTLFSSGLLIGVTLFGDIPWLWLTYPSLIGLGLSIVLLMLGAVINWPIVTVLFCSLWLKPTCLGIPFLLLLQLFAKYGWSLQRKISASIIAAILLYFLVITIVHF